MNKLLSLKLESGESFKKALAYQSISFWWFFRQFCYNILRDYEVDNKPKMLNILIGRFYLLINALFVFVLSCFLVKPRNNRHSPRLFVISPQNGWRKMRSLDPRVKMLKIDHNFHDVMSMMEGEASFIGLNDSQWLLLGDFRTFLEKRHDPDCVWKPLERFLTPRVAFSAWRYSRKLERHWNRAKREDGFRRFFKHWNVDRSHILRMDFFFRFVLFQQVLYIELMKRAVRVEKPDLILISQEFTGQGMAAVIASKLEKVPTIAFQHGIITPMHSGYFHLPGEISDKITPDHTLVADKTSVYGLYTRDVLVDSCGYPADAVVVTGQMRYDPLEHADRVFNRERTLKRFGFSPEKKTVLLITESYSRSHLFLRVVASALKNIPSVQAVIKPHPNDVHYEWHRTILENEGYAAAVAEPSSDTFELLFACDVMMTVTSTVAIEAMLMKKFVIVINLLGARDPTPYVEGGGAIGVYKENDVEPTIKNVLFDEKIQKEFEAKRERFLEYHLLHGKATENVVELIKEMIEGRT